MESPISNLIQTANLELKESNYLERINTSSSELLHFTRLGKLGFYSIARGYFSVELKEEDGSYSIIRLCGVGDLVGYGVWLWAERSKDYFLRSLQDGEVHFVAHDSFENLREAIPKVNNYIMDSLCQIIAIKDERISALEKHSVKQRISSLLLNLVKSFGVPTPEGRLIALQVEREKLAKLAATSTETFARVLTELEEKKIIIRKRRQILIKNERFLAKFK